MEIGENLGDMFSPLAPVKTDSEENAGFTNRPLKFVFLDNHIQPTA